MRKGGDILSTEVSDLWKRLAPIWTASFRLPRRDIETVEWVIPVWACVCWDSEIFSTLRDLKAWMGRLARVQLSEVVDALKDLDTMWLQNKEVSSIDTIHGVLSPFIRAYVSLGSSFWCNDTMLYLLRRYRTSALFLSHLTLHMGQEEESLAKFDANLERISQIHVKPTERMKCFIGELFCNIDPFGDRYSPHHGNGAVAEKGCSHIDKWKLVGTSAVKYTLRQFDQSTLPRNLRLCTNPAPKNRTSRVITVPKGISSRRIVCPEPTSLMFIQQGMRHVIESVFERSRLSSHVNLWDASFNTDLAKRGSIERNYATIDLSSASDSVRWDFVQDLFEKAPKWQAALKLARSTTRVYPDGSVKPNAHFAPMGSALCFPIQILCYCSLIEEAIARDGGTFRTYRVYGDDCIIHESHFVTFTSLLTEYGWIVNEDKTFSGDNPFRESCGGHFYNGYDVTPILAGRRLSVKRKHLRRCLGPLVDLHNRLSNDYRGAARHIAKYLQQEGFELLHSDQPDKNNALYTPYPPQNFARCKTPAAPTNPTVPWYQKPYYRVLTPKGRGTVYQLPEDWRYWEYFALKADRPVHYIEDPDETWVWSWTPLW